MTATFGGLLLGLLVGLRHAFEPDHLAAVSNLVAESPGARRGAWLGALWGVGHTLSLVVVGALLIVVGVAIPPSLTAAFECAVAAMLVFLGIRSLVRALRDGGTGDVLRHRHGGSEHVHATGAAHVHIGSAALAWRPLVVGLIHGLAGSGALTALVFAEIPGTALRVTYLVLFGAGSIAGMAIASGAAGASLGRIGNGPRSRRGFAVATGALSIVVGVVWAIPVIDVLRA